VNSELPLASGSGPARTSDKSSAFSLLSSMGGRASPHRSQSPSRPCALQRIECARIAQRREIRLESSSCRQDACSWRRTEGTRHGARPSISNIQLRNSYGRAFAGKTRLGRREIQRRPSREMPPRGHEHEHVRRSFGLIFRAVVWAVPRRRPSSIAEMPCLVCALRDKM